MILFFSEREPDFQNMFPLAVFLSEQQYDVVFFSTRPITLPIPTLDNKMSFQGGMGVVRILRYILAERPSHLVVEWGPGLPNSIKKLGWFLLNWNYFHKRMIVMLTARILRAKLVAAPHAFNIKNDKATSKLNEKKLHSKRFKNRGIISDFSDRQCFSYYLFDHENSKHIHEEYFNMKHLDNLRIIGTFRYTDWWINKMSVEKKLPESAFISVLMPKLSSSIDTEKVIEVIDMLAQHYPGKVGLKFHPRAPEHAWADKLQNLARFHVFDCPTMNAIAQSSCCIDFGSSAVLDAILLNRNTIIPIYCFSYSLLDAMAPFCVSSIEEVMKRVEESDQNTILKNSILPLLKFGSEGNSEIIKEVFF